jgi:hypothetical protein
MSGFPADFTDDPDDTADTEEGMVGAAERMRGRRLTADERRKVIAMVTDSDSSEFPVRRPAEPAPAGLADL